MHVYVELNVEYRPNFSHGTISPPVLVVRCLYKKKEFRNVYLQQITRKKIFLIRLKKMTKKKKNSHL